MGVLIRIAFRNLREHTSKSLIIGSLVVLGVIIIVLGNSLLDTASLGIHRMFIDNYTGDVFLYGTPKTPGATVSLFGIQGGSESESTPIFPEFDTVLAHLKSDPRVKAVTSQVTGAGLSRRRETTTGTSPCSSASTPRPILSSSRTRIWSRAATSPPGRRASWSPRVGSRTRARS